ncbi:MAG TPA: flagellar biosynthetic protein FliQ [Planctomycetota bacterium]|nr:flagellar biosynthetic protein FliQ [Planctomycetota bacterium]
MDSSDLSLAVDLGREVLWVAVKLSFPILLAAIVVSAVISVIQATTQLQDQTLNQVPKMFAVAAVIFVSMPWILSVMVEYTTDLVRNMGVWFQ